MDYAAIAKADFIPRLNGQQADYIFSRVGQLLDLPSRTRSGDHKPCRPGRRRGACPHCRLFRRSAAEPQKPRRLADAGRRIYENGDPAHFVMACASCHGPVAKAAVRFRGWQASMPITWRNNSAYSVLD